MANYTITVNTTYQKRDWSKLNDISLGFPATYSLKVKHYIIQYRG